MTITTTLHTHVLYGLYFMIRQMVVQWRIQDGAFGEHAPPPPPSHLVEEPAIAIATSD